MIVVDASILAVALIGDGADGDRARSVLGDADQVAVPDVANVETIAVLRKRWIDATIDAVRFEHAVRDPGDLPLQRFPSLPFLRRVVELLDDITAYDAPHVALAEAAQRTLVTAAAPLASAPGPRCAFRVL